MARSRRVVCRVALHSRSPPSNQASARIISRAYLGKVVGRMPRMGKGAFGFSDSCGLWDECLYSKDI